MVRHFAGVLLVALLATPSAAASLCDHQQRGQDPKKPENGARSDDPPRTKWWLDPDTRKELGLTDLQSKQINQIWEATTPKQRERWHEFEKLEDTLSQTVKENTADVATVTQLVERYEKLRAELNAARTVMIYKMHLVLTPEQRVKVDAMRARREQERKKQSDKSRDNRPSR